MFYLWATILCLVNAAWVLAIVIGLPGTWLLVLSTLLFAWLHWAPGQPSAEQVLGTPVLITVSALALVGEALEFLAGLIGTKRAGGSNWGAVGAIIGTVAGGVAGTVIPPPIIGSLVGACGGAALGAIVAELWTGRHFKFALLSGFGAGVGRLGGTVAKLVIGVVMWVLITVAVFWP